MDAQESCAGKVGVERVPVLTLMRSEGRESCLDTWGGGEVYTRLAGSSGQDLLPSVLAVFILCSGPTGSTGDCASTVCPGNTEL